MIMALMLAVAGAAILYTYDPVSQVNKFCDNPDERISREITGQAWIDE